MTIAEWYKMPAMLKPSWAATSPELTDTYAARPGRIIKWADPAVVIEVLADTRLYSTIASFEEALLWETFAQSQNQGRSAEATAKVDLKLSVNGRGH